MLILAFVLITWFIVMVIKKKRRGEDFWEKDTNY
jgi:hypothetical protein